MPQQGQYRLTDIEPAQAPTQAPTQASGPQSFEAPGGIGQYRLSDISAAPDTGNAASKKIEKDAQGFFARHPVIREGILGAFSGAGIAETQSPVSSTLKGMWTTFTGDPKTADEKVVANTPSGIPLPAYRLIKGVIQQTYGFGQEAFDSVDWNTFWRDYKRDPSLDPTKPIVDSGKLAHGAAGLATLMLTTLLGSKKAPEAVERITEVPGKVGEGITVTAQRMADTGPKLAKKTATEAAEDVTAHNTAALEKAAAAAEKHATEVKTVAAENAAAEARYQTEVQRAKEDFQAKVTEARRRHGAKVETRQKAVADATAEYGKKVRDLESAHKAKADALKSADELSQQLHTNTADAYKKIDSSFDERWDGLRDKVGKERPVNTAGIVESVKASRNKLGGIPADLGVFNDVLREVTEKPDAEAKGGSVIDQPDLTTEPGEVGAEVQHVPKDVAFDRLRKQFTALSKRAYSMPPGMPKSALLDVVHAYDKALTKAADDAGQAATYTGLKADWSRFMDDWHDMSSMSTGRGGQRIAKPGSPLARLYRMVDSPIIQKLVTGDFSERLLATMMRWKEFGIDPTLMAKVRNAVAQAKSIKYEAGGPPETFRGAPPPKLPTPPVEPKPIASVDPVIDRLRRQHETKLERKAADKPQPQPLPPPPPLPDIKRQPTVEEMRGMLDEAKAAKAWEAKERSLTWTQHDTVLGGLSLTGSFIGHNVGYAIPYTAARFGEMALVSSEFGRNWLSKITPQDIKVMQDVLNNAQSVDRVSTGQAIANGLADMAKRGQKPPLPLRMFQGLLSKAQLGSVLRYMTPGQSVTATDAASDAKLWQQARQKLGVDASVSAVADYVQQLKQQPASVSGAQQ